MTPQEKAQELFQKMKGFRVKHSHSKKCAIIAVDEILSTCPQKENEIFGVSKGIEYWQEVKSELEKIK